MENELWLILLTLFAFLGGMGAEHFINEKRWRKWKIHQKKQFDFWDNPEDEIWNDQ